MTKRKPNYLANNYFYSVLSTDSITPVSEPPMSTSTSTLQDIEITEFEVLSLYLAL